MAIILFVIMEAGNLSRKVPTYFNFNSIRTILYFREKQIKNPI